MMRLRLRLGHRAVRSALAAATLCFASFARAGVTTLAEPIVEENITDVDATDVGTVELDLTGATLAARRSPGRGTWSSDFEAEWRPVDRLGLGFSLGSSGPTSGLAPSADSTWTPRLAASYVLVRDRERHVFLQAEAAARRDFGATHALESPLETSLPYSFGFRWAALAGPLTLRTALLAEAGDTSAHAPFRQSYGALLEPLSGSGFYLGAELIEEWAHRSPWVAVPEFLILARVFSAPLRMGVGVPMTLGASDEAQWGLTFRVVIEPDE